MQEHLKPGEKENAATGNCTFHLQMSRFVGSSDIPVTVVDDESVVGRTVGETAILLHPLSR